MYEGIVAIYIFDSIYPRLKLWNVKSKQNMKSRMIASISSEALLNLLKIYGNESKKKWGQKENKNHI